MTTQRMLQARNVRTGQFVIDAYGNWQRVVEKTYDTEWNEVKLTYANGARESMSATGSIVVADGHKCCTKPACPYPGASGTHCQHCTAVTR